MVTAPLGDDMQKGGENVWISRIAIDLAGTRQRNLSSVQRQEPTEPQATTARWERGKAEGKPQGGPGEASPLAGFAPGPRSRLSVFSDVGFEGRSRRGQ